MPISVNDGHANAAIVILEGKLADVNPTPVEGMGMVVSDPPTQEQVQATSNKLDELLAVLKRS